MERGSESDEPTAGSPASALSRREVLKRSAVVGGALAWTVPTVQAISLTAAQADNPSGSRGNTSGTGRHGPPTWANNGGLGRS